MFLDGLSIDKWKHGGYICCMKHKVDKKDLKKRLSFVMMAQLDGLNGKRKEKMEEYLDKQLEKLADVYKDMLKRQKDKAAKKAAKIIVEHNEPLQQPVTSPGSATVTP
jgi:hypothetical protein